MNFYISHKGLRIIFLLEKLFPIIKNLTNVDNTNYTNEFYI